MVGERRCSGKEFHVPGAATRKLRLPNSVLVDGTHRSAVRRTKPHSSINFSEWGANAAEVRRAGRPTSDTVEGKHCNFELNSLLDRQPVKRVA